MASDHQHRKLAEFRVHGPFALVAVKNSHGRELSPDTPSTFWKAKDREALAKRCGCYVFAIRTSKKRYIPYYVGQTCAGFRGECFTRRNLSLYNRVLAGHGKSSAPVVFLICGQSGKVKSRIISEIETFFIQQGAAKNPSFLNVKGVPVPKWRIPGVIRGGVGKPSRAARAFKKAFGV